MTMHPRHYEQYSTLVSLLLAAANIVAVSFVLLMIKMATVGA